MHEQYSQGFIPYREETLVWFLIWLFGELGKDCKKKKKKKIHTKQKNLNMFGVLGSTSGNNFNMGTQNGSKLSLI